ncbi:cell division protein FtsX [Aquimarina agarivorans]|uniref:cell division protein FtsX n=1 Tax=Aquimarina agarivorans TaxID=980584 RepID=UPI000248F8FE|nr:permease-like cell division protein FtsX [Aquimarina agarivorans]
MSSKFEKYQKRRLISSYFSVILSIGLVLFLLGLLGLLVLNSKKVTDYFKEQIPLTIYLKDNAKEVETTQLTKKLKLSEAVKSAKFVSKKEAAATHSKEIGEDFISYLGTNPLQNSIDINLNAEFVNNVSIDDFVADILAKKFVDEVVYDKPLISLLNENIKRISFWVLLLCGIFTIIAVLLINNSIRLTVYAKRFTIKTMQMVGATKSFIRKPFIRLNLTLGILGGLLALSGMGAVLYYLDKTFIEFNFTSDIPMLAAVFCGVFLLGLFITWLSTFFAAQRFLSLQTDELYY